MGNSKKKDTFIVGPWLFSPIAKTLCAHDGRLLHLEDKISHLLETLAHNAGKTISRQQLIDEVWQGRELSEQTVPVAISKLRKALDDDVNNPQILTTIPRQGYKLIQSKTEHRTGSATVGEFPEKRWIEWFAAILAIMVAAYAILPQHHPRETIRLLNAEKPGIIVTINDVRTTEATADLIDRAIAISELSSYFLSQVPEILVIRHWWNLDAPDPTGGIYTRHGPATPVYSLKATIVRNGEDTDTAFILSNPKTDEVLWSGLYPIDAPNAVLFAKLATMVEELGVSTPDSSETLLTEDSRYWTARYFMELSNPRAAKVAMKHISEILNDTAPTTEVITAANVLSARWQSELGGSMQFKYLEKDTEYKNNNINNIPYNIDNSALLIFKDRNSSAAISQLEAILNIAPGDHYALSLLAEAHLIQGEKTQAISSYEKAIRLAPFAQAYQLRLKDILASP
jgi:DNA-binding winged helix-turn-helix (wHTH) protein